MKILFLDIDDTLLTRGKTITPENRQAIHDAVAAGHKVVIASGRPLHATLPIVEDLKLAHGGYIIAYNGGQIYDCEAKKFLINETLTMDQVREIFAIADKAGFHCQTYDVDDAALVRKEDPEIEYYSENIHLPYRILPELPDGLTQEPVKCMIIDLEMSDRFYDLERKMQKRFAGQLSIFISNPRYLECVHAGIDKGAAVSWFCRHMNVPIEDAIAAGDSENDISMLKAAGTGCAMANASDSAKAAADYVTENDCDHSGVAEIIHKFLL